MGWGTHFTTNLYLSRKLFRTIEEIEAAIQDLKDEIQEDKESLLIIGASSFKAISKEDENSVLELKNKVQDLVDNISANSVSVFTLNLYLEAVKSDKAKLTTNLTEI